MPNSVAHLFFPLNVCLLSLVRTGFVFTCNLPFYFFFVFFLLQWWCSQFYCTTVTNIWLVTHPLTQSLSLTHSLSPLSLSLFSTLYLCSTQQHVPDKSFLFKDAKAGVVKQLRSPLKNKKTSKKLCTLRGLGENWVLIIKLHSQFCFSYLTDFTQVKHAVMLNYEIV